jgi:predicted nucleic acid-binding protein
VICDANALITACKFTVDRELLVDILLRSCQVWLPQSVATEATENRQFPDAQAAVQRIQQGLLTVETPMTPVPTFLREYRIGAGETEAICLYLSKRGEIDYLVTDDKLVYLICDRMGIPKKLLPDLILELVRRDQLSKDQAQRMIEGARSRYSAGIIAHSKALVEEVPPHG